MRLWSLHPQYLDVRGLVALWREGLLAQAVLLGRTQGYQYHPQLLRFRAAPAPGEAIAAYLRFVHAEAEKRGYHFEATKIGRVGKVELLPVTRGQLHYEWRHLIGKLKTRAPSWLEQFVAVKEPDLHPLFRVITGGIAEWEVVPTSQIKSTKQT